MKQITASLYQIGLGFVNAFIVEGDGLTLIDTGMKGTSGKLFDEIRKGGKDPGQIKRIILTHGHPDHAGCAAEIKRELGVPVLAHALDASLIDAGISGRNMNCASGFMNWLAYHLFIKRAPKTIDPVKVDRLLSDGEVIEDAGGMRVIHTPGHSAGHISLLLSGEKVLIAADICSNIMGVNFSVAYEDISLGIQSVQKVTAFDFETAVFGHGNALNNNAREVIAQRFDMLSKKYKK